GELGADRAVGPWTYVEQQVGAVAGGADQVAHQRAHRLEVLVGDVEAPGVVHGERRFERHVRAHVVRVEPRRVGAGQVLLERLRVFTRARWLVVVGDDQRRGLEAVDQRVRRVELPGGV